MAIGVTVNILTVVVGGILGAVAGKRMSQEFAGKLTLVFGVCAMGMGISSLIQMENMPAVILAIVAGSSVGLACHVGEWMQKGGALMQKPIAGLMANANEGSGGLSQEESLSMLVTAVVLFCASGTGIYGCLDAGMTGDSTILLSKSILDLFTAAVFACSLGAVVSLVAVPQAVIYVSLFYGAKLILPLTTPVMVADFKACGGFLLIATGMRMAKIQDFPVADMLPAMVLAMPLSALWTGWVMPLL
ncbi:DUF554 domain-containing protein [Clostridiaceae bacterium]|nr:DUF554 domain-containing protein [Clostridiaceae bacterium]RKI18368.1 DUF554 domain-containing protein [bacterium 1XD21-70]